MKYKLTFLCNVNRVRAIVLNDCILGCKHDHDFSKRQLHDTSQLKNYEHCVPAFKLRTSVKVLTDHLRYINYAS